jgi:cytochrome b6-f complex iron-sulfur subunit
MTSRRSFLQRMWFVLGGVALVEYLAVAFDFLRPHRLLRGEAAGVVVAGPVARFAPESVTAFPAGRFYLARLADGGFIALSRVCTHLGCTVPWDAGVRRFVCPCHASSFDIAGAVLSPPAPRALDRYAVRIENGIVKVDTGKALRQDGHDDARAVYA